MAKNSKEEQRNENHRLDPLPPDFLRKLLWIRVNWRHYWKLYVLAMAVLIAIGAFRELDLLRSFFQNDRESHVARSEKERIQDSEASRHDNIEHSPGQKVTFVDKDNIKGPPAANEVRDIQSPRGKKIPKNTLLLAQVGKERNTVHVRLRLPGQESWSDFGDLPIKDGVITLPLKLVFLSQAKEDEMLVLPLSEKLVKNGFLTWIDKKDLLPGDDWQAKIEEAIESSDFVLIFLSTRSVDKTDHFQRQIKYALQMRDYRPAERRYIIPILLDDCEVPRAFKDIHWARYWEEGFFEGLLNALRE